MRQVTNTPLKLLIVAALTAALTTLMTGCGGGSSSSGTSAPVSPVPAQPQLGTYGGSGSGVNTPATLQLTSSGGTLSQSCGNSDALTEPLTTDASGHFDVTATASSPLGAMPSPVRLIGTVSGSTIIISEQYPGGTAGTPYTVVYGQQAPPFTGGCPG